MAIPTQPTDQTTPPRPTPEEIAVARIEAEDLLRSGGMIDNVNKIAIRVLLAATAPPTDEEIADFAVGYYETNDLGATTIRTRAKLLEFMHDAPSYRVSAMAAAIRHFLGPVKP